MIIPKVITPTVAKGFAIRQMGLGTDSYELTETYPPDTGIWQSKVLDLGSPKFQPNSTYAFDRSRYNNYGTITGAVWKRLPSGLWYLDYDGTDDGVTVLDSASLSALPALSILIWLKGTDTTNENQVIVSKYTAAQKEWLLYANPSTDFLRFACYDESADANIARDSSTTAGLYDGKWHLLSAIWSGATTHTGISLYRDLTQIDTTGSNTGTFVALDDKTATVVFGEGAQASGEDYKGSMALPRIFNVALTAAQRAGIYQQERHLFGV